MSQRKTVYTCPKCNKQFTDKHQVFCPHCGVNMYEYAEKSGKTIDSHSSPNDGWTYYRDHEWVEQVARADRILAYAVVRVERMFARRSSRRRYYYYVGT